MSLIPILAIIGSIVVVVNAAKPIPGALADFINSIRPLTEAIRKLKSEFTDARPDEPNNRDHDPPDDLPKNDDGKEGAGESEI